MGKQHENNSAQNNTDKIADLENKNAVLQDTVESFEDPNATPRVVRKGYTRPSIKFQKNSTRINPCTGEVTNPIPATK